MSTHPSAKIVVLVGLPGSGVTAATQYLRQRHVPGVSLNDILFDAMDAGGVDRTPDSVLDFRLQHLAAHGDDAIFQTALPQIQDLIAAGQRRIVVDGVASWTEYKAFKHEFPASLTVIALTAPKHLRWRRLARRIEFPMTEAQAAHRDYAEIEQLGIGGPIAAADYFIANDGSTERLHTSLDVVLRDVNFFA